LSKKDGSISVYCKLMDSVANMWFDCDLYGWKTFMCKLSLLKNSLLYFLFYCYYSRYTPLQPYVNTVYYICWDTSLKSVLKFWCLLVPQVLLNRPIPYIVESMWKLTKQRFAAADILTLRQLLSKKDGSISVYCKLMDSVANMWFDCDLYGWKTFMCVETRL
jgi:hypothetical protein